MRPFFVNLFSVCLLIAPLGAHAQTRCTNPLVEGLIETLLLQATQSGVPALIPFEQGSSLGGLEQLEMFGADPCMTRMLSLLKALNYTMSRRMSEAEAIFSKELSEDTAPEQMGIVDLMAHAGRAGVLSFQRRDAKAEALVRRLLPEFRRRFGPNNSLTLALEAALGDILLAARDYEAALKIYEDVGGEMERLLPSDHPLLCGILVNKAHAAMGIGRLDLVREILDKLADPSFAACSQLRRTGSPWIARAQRLDGALALSEGDWDNAIISLGAAHETAVRVFGDTHPQSLDALFLLAEAHAVAGHGTQAVDLVMVLNRSLKSWLDQEIIGTSQRAARSRLVRDHDRLQELASQIALTFPELETAQAAAADAVLKFKSIQLDEEAALSRLLRSDAVNPEARSLAKDVQRLRVQLSEAMRVVPDTDQPLDQTRVQALSRRLEAAEAKLPTVSQYFKSSEAMREGGLVPIQLALADRGSASVLVEYIKIADRDLGDLGWLVEPMEPNSMVWAAIVIDADTVRVTELSPGKPVESLLLPLRDPIAQFLSREGSDAERHNYGGYLKIAQSELYRLLVAPLDLEAFDDVILAPTAELSVANPFAFRMPDGRYWIENEAQTLQLVQSGRALLLEPATDPARGKFVGFGGVDYGKPEVGDAEWAFLNLTLAEAQRAADLMSQRRTLAATILTGADATENKIRQLAPDAYALHLSVHGFYDRPEPGAQHKLQGLDGDSAQPLMASGIALSGANTGGSSTDDGLLFAIEIQDLDFEGLELVFLSACETGTGKVEGLEGAHGVPRAFIIAGAQNIIAALRAVDEDHARQFSDIFYAQWTRGGEVSVQEAYHAAVREVIAAGDLIDWSAFIHFSGR